jgi:hypothetical protein
MRAFQSRKSSAWMLLATLRNASKTMDPCESKLVEAVHSKTVTPYVE